MEQYRLAVAASICFCARVALLVLVCILSVSLIIITTSRFEIDHFFFFIAMLEAHGPEYIVILQKIAQKATNKSQLTYCCSHYIYQCKDRYAAQSVVSCFVFLLFRFLRDNESTISKQSRAIKA